MDPAPSFCSEGPNSKRALYTSTFIRLHNSEQKAKSQAEILSLRRISNLREPTRVRPTLASASLVVKDGAPILDVFTSSGGLTDFCRVSYKFCDLVTGSAVRIRHCPATVS